MKNKDLKKYQIESQDEYVNEIIKNYENNGNYCFSIDHKRKYKKFSIKIITILCLMLALVGIAAGYYWGTKKLQKPFKNLTTVSKVVGVSTADAVDKVANTVVTVKSDIDSVLGVGSGVIFSSDGYIVTNAHVLCENQNVSDNVRITLNDKDKFQSEVIGVDTKNDIAVLKINTNELKCAAFADSDKLRRGEDLIVIGNPLGSLPGSVSNGIISYANRNITLEGQNTMNLIQTNAEINSGNSGGGAFLLDGQLIGIVFAKHGASDSEGLGFIIPSNKVKECIINIMKSKNLSIPKELQ